ncbi:MAG: PAS domain S-box protein [Acidimicrobiales bacterium]
MSAIPELATGLSQVFPPEPSSAGRARRFLAATLEEWGLDAELVHTVTLLASEVVTNAILHAATDFTVAVRRHGSGLRVEVSDLSRRLPARREYDLEAFTGRGLGIVEMVARDWGIEAQPDGKAVWFDLDDPGATLDDPPQAGPGPSIASAADRRWAVHFEHLPVRLAWATVQHGDALAREVALLALAAGSKSPIWGSPALDLTALIDEVQWAIERGDEAIDLVVRFPDGSDGDALRQLALVDEADRLAHEGALLMTPALPEIAACRRWLLGEIVFQVQGGAPTAWELPSISSISTPRVVLGEEERRTLDAPGTAAIAADDSNHIIYVNDEAAELLGWARSELTGRRLTVIVPTELRESHLAGYTRYHLTGETHLLDRPVRVPALRRDGSQVDVELFLHVLPRPGPQVVAATLRPVLDRRPYGPGP